LEINNNKGGTIMKSEDQEIEAIKKIIDFDYFLIKTINGEKDYDGQIIDINDNSLIIECWNVVKGNLCLTEIKFSDIEEIWSLEEMVWG
jgi:ribosome maturation factor RimP